MTHSKGGYISRRSVLKNGVVAAGAALVGGSVLTSSAAARRGNLVSRINSTGAYVTFPTPFSMNRRSKNPIDLHEDDGNGRWVAEPARGGNVRCRVENDEGNPPLPNAGFYVDIGPIGNVNSITINANSVKSSGDAANLTAGIYFDTSGDGSYFQWMPLRGNSERFVGFGDDGEALVLPLSFPSDETFTIGNETGMFSLAGPNNPTFGDYTDGKGLSLDTPAAIQVSVLGAGRGTVEEAIVEEMSVNRS